MVKIRGFGEDQHDYFLHSSTVVGIKERPSVSVAGAFKCSVFSLIFDLGISNKQFNVTSSGNIGLPKNI